MCFNGYLFDESRRRSAHALVIVSIILIILMILYFLHLSVILNPPEQIFSLALTFALLVLTCCVTLIARKTLHDVDTKYSCIRYKVILEKSGKQVELDLSMPFFLTKSLLRFHEGRFGHIYIPFFIFSPIPLNNSLWKENEKDALKRLLDSGAVLLPVNKDVNNWIQYTLGIHKIPEDPKVIFHPGFKR